MYVFILSICCPSAQLCFFRPVTIYTFVVKCNILKINAINDTIVHPSKSDSILILNNIWTLALKYEKK